MPYTIFVTPTAIDDIAIAVDYYNAVSADLGYRFARMDWNNLPRNKKTELYSCQLCFWYGEAGGVSEKKSVPLSDQTGNI